MSQPIYALNLFNIADREEYLAYSRRSAKEVQAQVEQASAWLRAQAPAQPTHDARQCPIHGVPMKQTSKNGRSWWSHRTADGSWCKGR